MFCSHSPSVLLIESYIRNQPYHLWKHFRSAAAYSVIYWKESLWEPSLQLLYRPHQEQRGWNVCLETGAVWLLIK